MILEPQANVAKYILSFGGADFVFSIERQGAGRFCCMSAAWGILRHENPGWFLGVIDNDPYTIDQIYLKEGDWTYYLQLPPHLNDELWLLSKADSAADSQDALDRYAERKGIIDEALSLIVMHLAPDWQQWSKPGSQPDP